jgi:hypothetical protein
MTISDGAYTIGVAALACGTSIAAGAELTGRISLALYVAAWVAAFGAFGVFLWLERRQIRCKRGPAP